MKVIETVDNPRESREVRITRRCFEVLEFIVETEHGGGLHDTVDDLLEDVIIEWVGCNFPFFQGYGVRRTKSGTHLPSRCHRASMVEEAAVLAKDHLDRIAEPFPTHESADCRPEFPVVDLAYRGEK